MTRTKHIKNYLYCNKSTEYSILQLRQVGSHGKLSKVLNSNILTDLEYKQQDNQKKNQSNKRVECVVSQVLDNLMHDASTDLPIRICREKTKKVVI